MLGGMIRRGEWILSIETSKMLLNNINLVYMKKLIALIAMIGLFTTSGIAFAQEDYELLVVFESDPKSIELDHGESYIDVEVDEKFTFTRKVVSIGMDTFTWEWNFDPEFLNCAPMPNIDSPDLECTALDEVLTEVSYTVIATMDDASVRVAESKVIKVQVGEGLPALPDYYGHPNFDAIDYLYANEIVEGYPDGTFKADHYLTRAELMKILVLGADYDPSVEDYNNCFPDVTDEWFAPYVCFAEDMDWVEGYEDGNFKPGEMVLKVEAIKMLLEIFKVNIEPAIENPYVDLPMNEWYTPYILTAQNLGLLEEETNYFPGYSITRGQVSENLYRVLMN